jgi:hypothetical protein
MSVAELIKNSRARWQHAPSAASEAEILAMAASAQVPLPPEYLDFFRHANGGEGDLAVGPGWFQLWPVEQVVDLNQAYGLKETLPGFFGIGSDGGGELLAFDTRAEPPWPVAAVPFIPLTATNAIKVALDFTAFVSCLGIRRQSP